VSDETYQEDRRMQTIHGLHSSSTHSVPRFAPGESVGANDEKAGMPFRTQAKPALARSMDAPSPHATQQSDCAVGFQCAHRVSDIGQP